MNPNIIAAVNDVVTQYPEYVPYIATLISSTVSGLAAYLVGKRKSSKSEFNELVIANKKFRDEVKLELDEAKKVIAEMGEEIQQKGKLIDQLQGDISDLKRQLIAKETKISDMQMDLIRKDYKINELQSKIQ